MNVHREANGFSPRFQAPAWEEGEKGGKAPSPLMGEGWGTGDKIKKNPLPQGEGKLPLDKLLSTRILRKSVGDVFHDIQP
jgi:hypothetical protein